MYSTFFLFLGKEVSLPALRAVELVRFQACELQPGRQRQADPEEGGEADPLRAAERRVLRTVRGVCERAPALGQGPDRNRGRGYPQAARGDRVLGQQQQQEAAAGDQDPRPLSLAPGGRQPTLLLHPPAQQPGPLPTLLRFEAEYVGAGSTAGRTAEQEFERPAPTQRRHDPCCYESRGTQ